MNFKCLKASREKEKTQAKSVAVHFIQKDMCKSQSETSPHSSATAVKRGTHHDNDILVSKLGEEQPAIGSRDWGQVVVVDFMVGLH